MALMPGCIRDASPADKADIININRLSTPGVSLLDHAYRARLFAECAYFKVVECDNRVIAYLCAIDNTANYDGEEFTWFRNNIDSGFIYIDQIAIHPAWRIRGIATLLYEDIFRLTAANQTINNIVCEVNHEPVNRQSQRLHQKLGFQEIHKLPVRGIVVSLLAKNMKR